MFRALLFVSTCSFLAGCPAPESPDDVEVDAQATIDAGIDGATQGDATIGSIDVELPVQATAPRRIVFLVHEFGFSDEATATITAPAQGEGAWTAEIASNDLKKSPVFKELADLASDVTIVTGLAVYPAIESRGEDTTLQTALLTGLPTAPTSRTPRQARGPSLDYLIHDHLGAVAGPLISVSKSLDLSYGMEGERLDSTSSAPAIFDRFASTGASNGCDLGSRPHAAAESSQRLSGWMNGVANILVRGIVCDRARVFTLSMPRPSVNEYVLSLSPTGDLDQDYNDRVGLSDASGQVAREVMVEQQRLVAKHVGVLASQLRGTATSSGNLLDDTLVVWVSNEARPGHAPSPWTAVLIGGRNLGLKGGRMLHFAQDRSLTIAANQQVIKFGLPHNRLLVSVAHLMGLDQTAIGASSIILSDGKRYDLSGALPGLQ